MRRRKLERSLEKRLLGCGILKRKIRTECVRVDLAPERRVLEKAFYFGAEKHVPVGEKRIIERFDSEIVARSVHRTGTHIPYDKREHSAKTCGKALAVLLPAVNDDLGIAAGLENVSPLGKLAAQIHEIVYFAVEHHDNAAVLVVHRLRAVGKVYYRQTPKSKVHRIGGLVSAHMEALHIGTAVNDAVRHVPQYFISVYYIPGKAYKSAHI